MIAFLLSFSEMGDTLIQIGPRKAAHEAHCPSNLSEGMRLYQQNTYTCTHLKQQNNNNCFVLIFRHSSFWYTILMENYRDP